MEDKPGTPEDDKSGTLEVDKSETPEDDKSETPEEDKTEIPEDDKSESKEKRVFEIPNELKESKKLDTDDDEDNKDDNLFLGTLKGSEEHFVGERRVSFSETAEDTEENKISGTTDNKQEHEYSKDANEKPDDEKTKQKDDDTQKPVSILKTSSSKFTQPVDTKEERVEVPDETSEDSSNRRPSIAERLRKKSVSIIDYLSGKSSDDEEEDDDPRKPRETTSWMGRKLLAFEKQLATDNIEKRMKNIFGPEPPEGDGKDKDEKDKGPGRVHLSSSMACAFMIGATTGGALTGLPYNLKQSGWFGVFLNLLIGFNALYAGLCTGWCWDMMEEKWPEYLEYSRIPYQDIGYRAVGMWMKYFVAFCVDLACLGSAAVYILQIADILEKLEFPLNFCFILIVVAFLMMPIMMFSSYRNFQFIGKLDVLASIIFVFLLIISFFLDRIDQKTEVYTDPNFESVAMAFAGFSFAYGSGAILPSIMADMTDRTLFPHSCATAYLICIVLYILLPLMGYAAYGDATPENILKELTYNENDYILRVIVNCTHIIQLLTSYVIALIPSLHAFEERTHCPDEFGFRRLLVRISIMVIILLVILGLPMLEKFLLLVGASIFNLCTFIFPPIFYVCLTYKTQRGNKRRFSKKEFLCIGEIIILGISVGVAATFVSISKLKSANKDRVSCYVNSSWLPEST